MYSTKMQQLPLVIKELETSNAKAKLHLAMLRNSKQSFFARNINSDIATNSFGSEKQFWNTMKYLMKEQSTITLQSGGKCAGKELDKAYMLNLYFSTCFNTCTLTPACPYESAEHLDLLEGTLENLLCTEENAMSILQKCTFLKQVTRTKSLIRC